jgi:probable addiction module antidote protein
MIKVRDYKEYLLEQLQDPEEAAAYLDAALQEDDPHVFLLALRDIAEAHGGMGWLAKQADLNRENLYRTLSLSGNPRFFNLLAVLDACGLGLSIHPSSKKKSKRTKATKKKKINPRPRVKRSKTLNDFTLREDRED